MSTTNTQSLNLKSLEQGKNKQYRNQTKIIFNYLLKYTATNTMISTATGVPQKNICRIKRNLEKRGLLFEVEKKLCKITGLSAYYLTTDYDVFAMFNQTKND
jgi:hypothetical protein